MQLRVWNQTISEAILLALVELVRIAVGWYQPSISTRFRFGVGASAG